MPITHLAFSDESCWNINRFRSLALLTLPIAHVSQTSDRIHEHLNESGVTEFKWQKVSNAKYRFAAMKMLDLLFVCVDRQELRVDVMIWDIEDARHQIQRRDDKANLGRIYYHLLRSVLSNRWPDGSVWRLFPDENSVIDWATVQDCLGWKINAVVVRQDLFTEGRFAFELREYFNIESVVVSKSHDEPLVQLADLLCGLGAYSFEGYEKFQAWREMSQPSLFGLLDEDSSGLSAADKVRCYVLSRFNAECKKRKLRVALDSTRGLFSHDPTKPINFWLYQPQHDEDRAPTRR